MRADEVFGSSHKGKCQKRYRHKKDWDVYDGETSLGRIMTNNKDPIEETKEVRDYIQKMKGTKAVLRWTAVDHFDCDEVVVTL